MKWIIFRVVTYKVDDHNRRFTGAPLHAPVFVIVYQNKTNKKYTNDIYKTSDLMYNKKRCK